MSRILIFLLVATILSCENKQENLLPELSKPELAAAQQLGKSMVKIGFESLSSELKTQISSKGIDSAIYACQLKAKPIIDSVAAANGVSIQRITRYTRNPDNEPNKIETHLIKLMEKAKGANEELFPLTFLVDSNTIAYYHPIFISAICLNCHGEPGITMQESTYNTVLEAYPKDRATGYKIDDLRGLWAVKFDKSVLN